MFRACSHYNSCQRGAPSRLRRSSPRMPHCACVNEEVQQNAATRRGATHLCGPAYAIVGTVQGMSSLEGKRGSSTFRCVGWATMTRYTV